MNRKKGEEILTCIRAITDIEPGVYIRKDSILVIFEKNIPSNEEIPKLDIALRKFGIVMQNHVLQHKFVSFVIK